MEISHLKTYLLEKGYLGFTIFENHQFIGLYSKISNSFQGFRSQVCHVWCTNVFSQTRRLGCNSPFIYIDFRQEHS
jgi:hypothetical protein